MTRLVDQLGLKDDDLRAPDHDDMCFSIVKKLNDGWGSGSRLRTDKEIFTRRPLTMQFGQKSTVDEIREQTTLAKFEYEAPILRDDRMIGFVDVLATFRTSGFGWCWGDDHTKVITPHVWEWNVGFEAKPRIGSAGQVVRQLKLYEHLLDARMWAAVYADDKKLAALTTMWGEKILTLERSTP